jgi:hypothetical protein
MPLDILECMVSGTRSLTLPSGFSTTDRHKCSSRVDDARVAANFFRPAADQRASTLV